MGEDFKIQVKDKDWGDYDVKWVNNYKERYLVRPKGEKCK